MITKNIYNLNYIRQRSIPLTNRMGIYFGINEQSKEIVYIGKAKDFFKRIPNSLEEKIKSKQNENCKDYGCERHQFFPCDTVEEMNKQEKEAIIFWKPYYNKQHNSDYYMNNNNKRLREILQKEFGRNLYTYEILFSHNALNKYYSNGNTFGLAKYYIKSNSTIGNTKKNKEQKEKEINRVARKLKNIIRIHYDYFKHFCERTEEEKERLKND